MSVEHGPARRWLRRAAFAAAFAAITGLAWAGYRTGDSQAAWVAMWSLCAPAN